MVQPHTVQPQLAKQGSKNDLVPTLLRSRAATTWTWLLAANVFGGLTRNHCVLGMLQHLSGLGQIQSKLFRCEGTAAQAGDLLDIFHLTFVMLDDYLNLHLHGRLPVSWRTRRLASFALNVRRLSQGRK